MFSFDFTAKFNIFIVAFKHDYVVPNMYDACISFIFQPNIAIKFFNLKNIAYSKYKFV